MINLIIWYTYTKLSQAQIFQGEIPPKFPHPKVQNGEFPPYESPKWGINPKIMKIEKKCLKIQFYVSRSTQASKLDH